MLQNVRKLMPGDSTWKFPNPAPSGVQFGTYYQIPFDESRLNPENLTYEQQQQKLSALLEESVQQRLVADVPLGTFLSGGIDSSVITTLASRHVEPAQYFFGGLPRRALLRRNALRAVGG